MTHLYLISPAASILQNMDYFLYNLDIEWEKNKIPIKICVTYGNKLKIKPVITVRISIYLSVSVV